MCQLDNSRQNTIPGKMKVGELGRSEANIPPGRGRGPWAEAVNLYLFAFLNLDSVLRLEIEFIWRCVTQGKLHLHLHLQGCDRVC